MSYMIVTADRCFTEAHCTSWAEVVEHWAEEIRAGTHRVWIFGP
jgi:hypothetical protein